MERWSLSKLDFLIWWAWPTLLLSLPVVGVAWLINAITGGAFQTILTIIAVVIITIIATLHAVYILFWADVR